MFATTVEEESVEYDDDEPMTLTEFQQSVHRMLGADLPMGEAFRLSRWQFQARQAGRYRDGRILLAGDAAHLLPATGAALNLGMLDAVNLAWKLAADIRGGAPSGLLDTYETERRYAGERALLQTRAQVALRRGTDPAADALREVVQELLADEQPARRLGALIAGADLRYPGSDPHPLTGTFVTDLTLQTGQGTTSVAALLHRARPILLVRADRADLREAAAGWLDRVDIRTAGTEQRPTDALLIRPDGHIAWAAAIDEPADTAVPRLHQALSEWFGDPTPPITPQNDTEVPGVAR
ncbi:FAD-dependent monooxygenase [Cryptosporangium phraense]|uniref:FAD-binding monooxygenase n=1 Tax=Cryptosporangium phraense TaxID=2593070 RepID=A0A545AX42_9ACTN|nr:FAD-dependent monooxygenase [Cryptosporangium phraense]TQS45903.1 FAD-binding monooxygenase [Cryptosporangium phraense]